MNFNLSKSLVLFKAPRLLKGETQKKGMPISCRVMAYNRANGQLLSSTLSNQDGQYFLFGERTSFILALDPAKQYNAVIQDNVVPK